MQDETREHDVEYMLGGLMTARLDAARRVRFDERLRGYALLEDEDFSYRLSRRGRVRYEPRAAIHHRTLGVSGARSREFNRQLVRNRAYLFRKNFSATPLHRLQFAGLVLLLFAHRAVNGDWRGLVGLAEGCRDAWRDRRWR